MNHQNDIEFYTSDDGHLKIDVTVQDESVWLTQVQMANLFDKDRNTISEHIQNIFKEGELEQEATNRKFRSLQKEGNRSITREREHYNLDVIISVGYRVKSKQGTQFRKWATSVLKDHLLKGYTLNQKRLEQQGKDFQNLTSLLEHSVKKYELGSPEAIEMISIIKSYAYSFTLLQQYDEQTLQDPKGTIPHKELSIHDARHLIQEFKTTLMKKGEATSLFGNEKDNSFEAIIGNIEQTFGGQYLYNTIEKKAAHLL